MHWCYTLCWIFLPISSFPHFVVVYTYFNSIIVFLHFSSTHFTMVCVVVVLVCFVISFFYEILPYSSYMQLSLVLH